MSDVRLKIRHVKRSGDTVLDLSGMGLTEIPEDVFSLTSLESLDISENSIVSLGKIAALHSLKNLYAKNNKISALPEGILELDKLENLKLDGNTVAVMNTDLSVVFGITKVRQVLQSYFDTEKDSSISLPKPGFLGSSNLNDATYLRKKIADLQMEIADLKFSSTGSAKLGTKSLEEQKNWMSSGPSHGARPQTANSQMNKVRELEDDLKNERSNNKMLSSEVNMLKNEISKNKILTSAAGEEGTISGVPGVMEIPYEELKMEDQIGQGGFSVIKRGTWRSTDVAIKIIVDPVITDELIAEVKNEVQMLSLLRHPKIVMLMGVSSQTNNLAIVFECMSKGCLFDILHTSGIAMSLDQRLRIGYETAGIFSFLHQSGVVHRDLKSYNILLDDNLNIKL
jgi:Leucine-rich repeat (LRR) protein